LSTTGHTLAKNTDAVGQLLQEDRVIHPRAPATGAGRQETGGRKDELRIAECPSY
jgi:hypothetical protein